MYDDKWDDLDPKSIERDLWIEIAKEMLRSVWEHLNNPGFNPIEFDGIRKQAGNEDQRTKQ
jgi:hypothetical protein